jgi:glycosyltransferase involved in cell wall biosynthesis
MYPVISIIIPCYNQGQYILDAISSVEQYPDNSVYEIIIINDGSTDEISITVLKSLEEKGYHVLNQNNQGLSMARNNGIAIAKGKYILPLDADSLKSE